LAPDTATKDTNYMYIQPAMKYCTVKPTILTALNFGTEVY